MERMALNQLLKWKESPTRKPLLLAGARQVGKTWLMREFGRRNFKNVAYLNFESSTRLKKLFEEDFTIDRIIATVEIETNQKIEAKDTLIIFDEIQEANRGLTSLKYFYEQAPQYFIVAAGSLLGISMQKETSFPVGKVDLQQLHPISFSEFLISTGQERLAKELEAKNWAVISVFHDKLIELLRLYYFIGGMPEVVSNYLMHKDLQACRTIQQKILAGYQLDFGKHVPGNLLPRIRLVWNNLVSQLAKENKKFIYGQVKKGSRAKEFELAINWLISAGLLIKVSRIKKGVLPLNAHADLDAFKLFFVDIGLLNAMAELEASALVEKNKILTEFKGALTEQYVCQQLVTSIGANLFYWSAANGSAEVDFVIQQQNAIVPIEVKAEENLKSKSLQVFVEKFKTPEAIRLSMSPYRKQDWMTNIPLYGTHSITSAD
jgi:uncharacterized protein